MEEDEHPLANVEHVIALGEMGGLQVLFLQLLAAMAENGAPVKSVIDRSTRGPHSDFMPFAEMIRSPNRSRVLDVTRNLTKSAGGTKVGSTLTRIAHSNRRAFRSVSRSPVLHWNSLDASDAFVRNRAQALYDHGYSTLKYANAIEVDRLKRMRGIICVSQSARDSLRNRFDVDQPIEVVPNPIRDLPALDSSRRALQRSGKSSITLGTASRLVPMKGVSLALRTIAVMRQQGIDARLEVAGEGPEKPRLARLARRLGVESVTRFHGHVPNIAMFFENIDVLLALSLREPFGLTPLEALSCGVPVIASDVEGHRENLTNFRAAHLVDLAGISVYAREPRVLSRQDDESPLADQFYLDVGELAVASLQTPPETLRTESFTVKSLYGIDAYLTHLSSVLTQFFPTARDGI